jgi:hypothetical protein
VLFVITGKLIPKSIILTVALVMKTSIASGQNQDFDRRHGTGGLGSDLDGQDLMRIPDLNSPSSAPPSVPQPVSAAPASKAPLAWRVSAYNLALNKLPAHTRWSAPIRFDQTKSYLRAALSQLGFTFRSAYPQAGQFLVVPAPPDRTQSPIAQIIIVAQPTSENETALQMMITGDMRNLDQQLDQQKVQQIPQVMLMLVQRKGLL